jgi:hypothetical protein
LNRNGGSTSLFDAFSSREPVSISLENALVCLFLLKKFGIQNTNTGI